MKYNYRPVQFLFILFFCSTLLSVAQQSELVAKGAKLTLIADGYSFTEGPASDREGNVYFTDQPNNRILKWNVESQSVNTFLENARRSNGLYTDAKGGLLSAADKNNELLRISGEKEVDALINSFEGRKLNGPNDLWKAPNGDIYITDPYYYREWWDHTTPQQPENRVYFLAQNTKKPVIAAENLIQPNGIIGTPDGKALYVSDIDANKIYKYDIASNGELKNRSLFANEKSDGMTIDNLGNIYLSGNGVTILNKDGKKIHHIKVPQPWTANVTFGGPQHKMLFITASEAVYSLEMNVHGVQW